MRHTLCQYKLNFAALILLFYVAACGPFVDPMFGGFGGAEHQALIDWENPTGAWEMLTPAAAFSPRDVAKGVSFNGKLWLSNGFYHGNITTRDLWSSDDGVEWTLVNNSTPYDAYSELVSFQGKMWAISCSIWNSNDGVNWTQIVAKTPFAHCGGKPVLFNGEIWFLGAGQEIWKSSDGQNWIKVTGDAPFGNRSLSAVTIFHNKIWLISGSTPEPSAEKGYQHLTSRNDVWCSDDGVTWERVLEHAPWAARLWFPAVVYRGRMWIIGGYDNVNNGNLGDVWFTEDGINWTQFESDYVFEPRHAPTTYVHNGSLLVVAGNTWPVKNDVWALTVE